MQSLFANICSIVWLLNFHAEIKTLHPLIPSPVHCLSVFSFPAFATYLWTALLTDKLLFSGSFHLSDYDMKRSCLFPVFLSVFPSCLSVFSSCFVIFSY